MALNDIISANQIFISRENEGVAAVIFNLLVTIIVLGGYIK